MPRFTMSSSVAIAPWRSPRLPLHRGELSEGSREPRVIARDRRAACHRVRRVSGIERLHRIVEIVRRPDECLRVVVRRVDASRRIGARADVPERLQPLPRLGIERRLLCVRAREQRRRWRRRAAARPACARARDRVRTRSSSRAGRRRGRTAPESEASISLAPPATMAVSGAQLRVRLASIASRYAVAGGSARGH